MVRSRHQGWAGAFLRSCVSGSDEEPGTGWCRKINSPSDTMARPPTIEGDILGGTRYATSGKLLNYQDLEPRPISTAKPLLIDVSDLIAYISARALSTGESRYKNRCIALYERCTPTVGHVLWLPPDWVPIPGEEELVSGEKHFCEWGWINPDRGKPEPFVAAKIPKGATSGLPANPRLDLTIHAVAQVVGGKEVGVLLCLMRIEGLPVTLIAPVNHYWSYSRNPLTRLQETREIRVYLYEDRPAPERQLIWRSVDLGELESLVASIASLSPWSDQAFLLALRAFRDAPDKLWDMDSKARLGGSGEREPA